jgi:hypothetical protein
LQAKPAIVSINEDDIPQNQSVSTIGPAGLFNMDWGDNRFSDASLFVADGEDYIDEIRNDIMDY